MVRAAARQASYDDDDASASLTSSAAAGSSGPSPEAPDRTAGRGKGVAKPTSERRAAANRLNARQSTGPRTAAGRAASRFNALRHGLCARVVLLPGEDRRAYEAFARAFADDLRPLGVTQAGTGATDRRGSGSGVASHGGDGSGAGGARRARCARHAGAERSQWRRPVGRSDHRATRLRAATRGMNRAPAPRSACPPHPSS